MISLNAHLAAKIEREMITGLNPKTIDRMLARAITQLVKKYRDKITVGAASKSGVNADRIDRRSHVFLPKGKRKQGKISYLAFDFPAAVLSPRETPGGVSAEGFQYPGYFMATAERKSGKGSRLFVFRRRGHGRYPLMEARVRVFGPIISAMEDQRIEIEKEFTAFVSRELEKYVRGIKSSYR